MKIILLLVVSITFTSAAQKPTNADIFWNTLETYCGKAYEGEIKHGAVANDGFTGEKLVMHVRTCNKNEIRIPFFVGGNKSRTWVLTRDSQGLISLKHDHRNPDGTEEAITQYGGISPNYGLPNLQIFPADAQTSELIEAASTNVWWFSIDETGFSYNLQRIGSDRLFSVRFDLTHPVKTPEAPWGTKE